RQFIDTFLSRVASYATNQEDINRPPEQYSEPEPVYMVSALRDLRPIISDQFPDLMQRLSVAEVQANSLVTSAMQKPLDDREKEKDRLSQTFDDSLTALEKADAD